MAHKEDLQKVAHEGFAMVKEFESRSLRHVMNENKVQSLSTSPYQYPYPYPYARNFLANPPTIDCNQAAKKYSGVVVQDFERKYGI
ncbi:hypothetical protein F511_22707 [Dorcoceras hygrometricum]|uniref:Uncharacterized protein n=1 Tax=Dorcoceras hygrometricum TaxID=472368 RepID=A0A2Z7AMG4_9LAMI|nr:hypothetical protein F511_05284 [Dorcoceras hygrometricum]KZV39682.1 hypothetical protein F511_22707 [Dorcoceras hygrometricum]